MALVQRFSITDQGKAVLLPGPVFWLLLRMLITLTMITTSAVVTGQPIFTTPPHNVTTNVTEPLTVVCRAEASSGGTTWPQAPAPIIRWFRALRTDQADVLIDIIVHKPDSKEGDEDGGGAEDDDRDDEEEDVHVWATKEGDMIFKEVAADDEGWYYCTAGRQGVVVVYSDPVYLNVQVPPVVTNISKPPETPYQAQVNLSCSATGDPVPEITWRSPDGREVDGSEAGYGLANAVLTISGATNQKDGGWWACVACNMLGCDEATTLLRAHGQPLIQGVQATQNSTTIRLACQALGLPAPNFTYQTEGSTVADLEGHTTVEGQLYVGRNMRKDTYTCTATNQYGQASLNMSRPIAPHLVNATTSARFVTLAVITANRLGHLPLVGVCVEVRTPSQFNWTAKYIPITPATSAVSDVSLSSQTELEGSTNLLGSVVSGAAAEDEASSDGLEVTAIGLDPYTAYYVRVRLVNVLGKGPPSSDSLEIFTLADVPPPPEEVNVTSGDKGLTITWKVPQHLNGNKAAIYFKVIVADSAGSTVSQSLLPATQTPKVNLDDLDLGNHVVSIATINSELQRSSDNVTLSVNVTQAVPEFIPNITGVVALSDDTVEVTWQTPEDPATLKQPVDGYVIRVVSASYRSTEFFWVNESTLSSYNMTGLTERATYTCAVAAFNVGGRGPYCPLSTVTTHYALFSHKAYSPEVELSMSGKWIAIMAGILSAVVLVFLVCCVVRHWHSYSYANSLDLTQPTHGLDPLYLENPKGLHQTAHWNTVGWLRSFGAGRILGTASSNSINITTSTLNNNNATVGSYYSGSGRRTDEEDVTGRGDVAVVAMEIAPGGQQTTGDERGQRRENRPPWWKRFRLTPSTWTRPSFISALSSKRRWGKRKSARPTIQHPHFSGRGATVTMTSSSATSLPPAGFVLHDHGHRHLHHHDGRPLTLIPRHLSLGGDPADMFPDVVSLSSSSGYSLTLTSVSSEVNDTHFPGSSSCDMAPELDTGRGWVGPPAPAVRFIEEGKDEEHRVGRSSQIQEAVQDLGQPTPEAAESRSVLPPVSTKANSEEHLHQTNKGRIHQSDKGDNIHRCGKEDVHRLDKEQTHRCDAEHSRQPDKQRADHESNKNCQHPGHLLDEELAGAKSVTEGKQEKRSSHSHANAGLRISRRLSNHHPQASGTNPPDSDSDHGFQASEHTKSNKCSSKINYYSAVCGRAERKKDDDTERNVLSLNHEKGREMTPSKKAVIVPDRCLILQHLNPENTDDRVGVETVEGRSDEKTQHTRDDGIHTFSCREGRESARCEEPATGADYLSGVMFPQQSSVKTMAVDISANVPTEGESSDDAVSVETARQCRGTGGGCGDDVMYEADQAVTVTDGESVYHILQLLDQELDAHELSDAPDSDTPDEDSLGGSWSQDAHHSFMKPQLSRPPRSGSEHPVDGNVYQRGSFRGHNQPPDLYGNGFCEDNQHGKYCKRGVTPENPRDFCPPARKHLNASLRCFNNNSHFQPNQNQPKATEEKSPVTKTEGSQKVKQFPSWRKASSNHIDHSSATGDRSSPTVNKLFNAESDSYDVNPLSCGPASTNLYSEDRPSTISKTYKHLGSYRELFPANTVTEKSFARRHPVSLGQLFPTDKNTAGKSFVREFTGSRAADVDVSERKALEELVSTLDSLGPSSYADTGGRPAAPQTFYTLQRNPAPVGSLWGHDLGVNAVGGQQNKFYTLQRGSQDRGKVFGTIRSLDSTGLNETHRSERSNKGGDLFTGFSHVAPPGDLWCQPETGWPRHSVSAGGSLVTSGRKKGSKRKVLTMPRKGFMDLFRHHSSSHSSSIGSSGDGLHERGELNETGAMPDAKGRGPAVKDDVVFGNNNVGYETANLY